jgi:hypothetical protein
MWLIKQIIIIIIIEQSPLWGRYVVSFLCMDFSVFIVVYN